MVVEGRQWTVCVHERCGAGICDRRPCVNERPRNLFGKGSTTEDHGLVVQCSIPVDLEDYVIHGPVAVRTFDRNSGQFAAVLESVNLSKLDRWGYTLCCRVEIRGENWKV